jgi:hypothetical protein
MLRRHVIGSHSTQETRIQNAFNDVASTIHRPYRPARCSRHIIGSHSTQETRIQNAFNDVASTIQRPLLGGTLQLGGCRVLVHRLCVPCLYNERLNGCPGLMEAGRTVNCAGGARCSPRHRQPPHSVLIRTTPSTTQCTGARHVIHHIVYRCALHPPPYSLPIRTTPSTT